MTDGNLGRNAAFRHIGHSKAPTCKLGDCMVVSDFLVGDACRSFGAREVRPTVTFYLTSLLTIRQDNNIKMEGFRVLPITLLVRLPITEASLHSLQKLMILVLSQSW